MSDPREQLDDLISRHLDGGLDAAETAQLREMIDRDSEALDRYIDLLTVDADSRWSLGVVRSEAPNAEPSLPLSPRERVGVRANFKHSPGLLALAAALGLAAAVIAIYIFVINPQSETRDPQSDRPVATLIETTGGTLTTPHDFPNEGSQYGPGEYTLDSGTAEFMLTNAVNVRLRGETRMFMRNDMDVSLARGTAEFVVPRDAKGFTVHLPDGSKVIDLGTRFVTTVEEGGAIRTRVIDGEVRLVAIQTGDRFLGVGETAYLIDGSVVATAIETTVNADADAFVQGGDQANKNFGRLDQLQVKSDDSPVSGLDRKVYIRFNISRSVTDDPRAVLSLDYRGIAGGSGDHTFNVVGLNDGDAGEAWNEDTITWNNAPRNNTGSPASFTSGTTPLGTLSVARGKARGADIAFRSAALDAFLAADTDGRITIMLSRVSPKNAASNSSFWSKDNAEGFDAPRLRVDLIEPHTEPKQPAPTGTPGVDGPPRDER